MLGPMGESDLNLAGLGVFLIVSDSAGWKSERSMSSRTKKQLSQKRNSFETTNNYQT